MIRTIFKPDQNKLTLNLPDYFIGKQIEVIAFVIEEVIQKSKGSKKISVLDVPDELKKEYKFNRDEANER